MSKVFQIITAVSITAPKFLKAAFANHEKQGRMLKGAITKEGATFFATREGRDWTKCRADYEAAVKSQGYEFHQRDGVEWPHKRGVNWQPGAGFIGKAAFFFALCDLTGQAAKAATTAKAAQDKATTKPAASKTKPATAKTATTKPASKAKAKPVTVTA